MSRSKRGLLLRNMNIFLTIWILAALSIGLSVADAGNSTELILQPEDREELRAFVEEARDFAMNSSKEMALHAFNDREGNFTRGNRYIFAFDSQGNLLANPVRPELIGQNRLNQTDPNLKMSYVTKIDDSWWLGSGIYWSK